MKRNVALVAGLLVLAFSVPSFAADAPKGKEMTITGEGKCGKCSMHETEKCQNVIQTKADGKTVNYYLADNKVSKDFHSNVCKESKKVTATGTVKDVDGKKEFTATKIAVAE